MTRAVRALCRDWKRVGGLFLPTAEGTRLVRPPYPGHRWFDAARFALYTSQARWALALLEEAGAAGDVKLSYAASSAITVTALNGGVAASATWVAGWESGAIDNSSNLYLDYRVNGVLVTESSGTAAGEGRMYGVPELNDSAFPDSFDGTESTETVTDTEERDQICFPLAAGVYDGTASGSIYLLCPSVLARLGDVPRKFVLFIAHSTTAALETSGNAVYVAGRYAAVAAA